MRHWHVSKLEANGESAYMIFGNFYNRDGFANGSTGHSSPIQSVKINRAEQEYEIKTGKTLYHCSFESLSFEEQDNSDFPLPEYESIKKEYEHPVITAGLTKKDMLLVLSHTDDHFFEKLWYRTKKGSEGSYRGTAHTGVYTDSYILRGDDKQEDDSHRIDIRYFIDKYTIEFYALHTGNRKLWIENHGSEWLYINNGDGTTNLNRIKLRPWERIQLQGGQQPAL
jgi:hypothetical protein